MSEEMVILKELKEVKAMLAVLVERQQVREWYSVEEFARIVGRAEYTCREWARQGRIRAEKKDSGRGAHASWSISHHELLRYQREGLLPIQSPRNRLQLLRRASTGVSRAR